MTDRTVRPVNLKRKRPQEESDDDDMSLLSQSPSPTSQNDMDVDEYVRNPPREVITVDTKIKPSNKGYALLRKLGWHEGQPVGLSAEGKTEPVPFYVKSDFTSLGKANLDLQMIEKTVSELDSERQIRETEEQYMVRDDSIIRNFAPEADVSSAVMLFFCELCDKQFRTAAQYDEHNSYAHQHGARFNTLSQQLEPQGTT